MKHRTRRTFAPIHLAPAGFLAAAAAAAVLIESLEGDSSRWRDYLRPDVTYTVRKKTQDGDGQFFTTTRKCVSPVGDAGQTILPAGAPFRVVLSVGVAWRPEYVYYDTLRAHSCARALLYVRTVRRDGG
eukprot:scaffold26088_cov132-Cylindrotheca_fusiformis.AAC.1